MPNSQSVASPDITMINRAQVETVAEHADEHGDNSPKVV
jgi:hypothetical protein